MTYFADGFFDMLRHRFEQNEFSDKYHNDLFSPACFDLDRDTDHGHSLSNVVDVTGVVLDFDHVDLTPQQVQAVLPFRMCIYSSHSHAPDNVCFRVVIPTRTPMTADASKAIRMMCVRRFEEHGYEGSGYVGRKHGIDTSKMHAASLFFMPCRRPGGFFEIYAGMPLDPDEWIKACPSDIVDNVMNEPGGVIPVCTKPWQATNGTIQADRAIAYWQAHGPAQGQGRVQFWALAVKLAEAGCDASQMSAILVEQAGYAHNPAERHAEIAALLKDKKVDAAMRC
jgi:hypothetical protein